MAPASVASPGCPAPGPRHEPAAAEVPPAAPVPSAVETGDTVAADICCHLAGVLAWVLGVGDKETCPVSNSSASLSKHPPDQRRWLVEAGPAPPPPRVHSDTSGTDRGL